MKVAVFGGSGFIGSHLIRELMRRGDEAVLVSRSAKRGVLPVDSQSGGQVREESGALSAAPAGREHTVSAVTWRELENDPSPLEGCTALVNLAGETINQRWTQAAKRRILQSRLDAAERVAGIVRKLKQKPSVVLNGSGMSIYGYSATDTFDESCPGDGTDFLAGVVREWERAADNIGVHDVRVVKLRTGLVLGGDGGAFPLMVLPYKLFAGGRVGSGRQIMSWIHVRDMVGIMLHCIAHEEIAGPVNCTAPSPVTSDEFGRAVAKALGRPHWLPAPAFMFRLAFGEMSELLLNGQRVLPGVALKSGYTFAFPTINDAVFDLLT